MKKTACIILNYNDSESVFILYNKIKNYETLDYIIIVDNCSTDQSYLKLKELEDKIKVFVIQTDFNGGYGYGNNYGIKFVNKNLKAQFLLIANPDVFFLNESVFKMKEFLNTHTNFAVVAPKHYYKGKIIAWKKMKKIDEIFSSTVLFTRLLKKRYYSDQFFEEEKKTNGYFAIVDSVPGSLLMINSEDMEQCGMYDEDFFLFEEEKVLAEKLSLANLKTAVLLDSEYQHNHSTSINKEYNLVASKRILLESKKRLLKKYYSINTFDSFLINSIFPLALIEMFLIQKIKLTELKWKI